MKGFRSLKTPLCNNHQASKAPPETTRALKSFTQNITALAGGGSILSVREEIVANALYESSSWLH